MATKKWKKGYKIVKKNDGKWKSLNSTSGVDYKLNIVTKRLIIQEGSRTFIAGPLCIFSNFVDAYNFLIEKNDEVLFECKYRESDDDKIWFLKNKRDAHRCQIRGKVLADEVKLIKKINKREMKKLLEKEGYESSYI